LLAKISVLVSHQQTDFGRAVMVSFRILGLTCLSSVAAWGTYDETRAIKFLKLAASAYCDDSALESWSCGPYCDDVPVSHVSVCQGKTTKAYVGIWEGKGLLSVEGSSDTAALVKDLEFLKSGTDWPECDGCKAHGGFLDEWNAMETCVKNSLAQKGAPSGSTIRTTGHSLGAAINLIAMLDLSYDGWKIEESYHFGTPRTGNHEFAQAWNAKFSEVAFRVTHHKDPVPQVPPDQWFWGIADWGFEHVEPEIFYEHEIEDGYNMCTVAHTNDMGCAEYHWDNVEDLTFHISDHLHYLSLPTGCSAEGKSDVVV